MKPIRPQTLSDMAKNLTDIQHEINSYTRHLQLLTEETNDKREIFKETTAKKLQGTLPIMQEAFFEVWIEGFNAGLIQAQNKCTGETDGQG